LYSVWLKRLLIVDMMLLASFYILRVFLGSAATGIRISSWTALFCLFIFSGLAALKRYAEIFNRTAPSSSFENRRAYRQEDAMPLLSIGTSSFIGAVVALGLYLGSPDVRGLYRAPDLLWLICPTLLGWSSRIWILAQRGELRDEDPVAFVIRDRWSHAAGLLLVIIFLLAL
jgi:4-hydroxybenzoate polyprenyltransferase